MAAVSRTGIDGRRRSRRICPTRGARPRTSSGRRRFPATAGRRRSCGAIASSSRRSFRSATSRRRRRASTSAANGRRRRSIIAGWSTRSTAPPERSCGSGKRIGACRPAPRHLKNTYASETPVTDGSASTCRSATSASSPTTSPARWSGRCAVDPSPTRNGWGTAASPGLHKGRLYVVNDNEQQSYLTALDARTGKTVWRADRQEDTTWATPYIWEHAGRTEIITRPPARFARTTSKASRCGSWARCRASRFRRRSRSSACSTSRPDTWATTTRPVYAIKPGARATSRSEEARPAMPSIAWSLPQGGPYNPSPLVYGDHYYTLFDRGFFTCSRREDRQGDLHEGPARSRPPAASAPRRGPTTASCSR